MISALWIFFILSFSLGSRVILGSVIPGFHEYETISLYGSDIFLILFIVTFFYLHGKDYLSYLKRNRFVFILLGILALGLVSILSADSQVLALYSSVRVVLLGVVATSLPVLFKNNPKLFNITVVLIAVIAVTQAGVGILQFVAQSSLGLGILGESPVAVDVIGSSVVSGDYGRVLRAYGLFPHPNIFAAFLLLGLWALLSIYIQLDKKLYVFDFSKGVKVNFLKFIRSRYFLGRMITAGATFLVVTALIMSFSRSAWLAGVIGCVLLLGFSLHSHVKPVLRALMVILVSFLMIYLVLSPVIISRASITSTEPAVNYRLIYTKIGLETFVNNPFGVGAGNQVLSAVNDERYKANGIDKVWEIEPVHNVYMLVFIELGGVAGIFFIIFLFSLWKRLAHILNERALLIVALLSTFLIIALFDHFFWSINQGKLLWWIVIGLALTEVERD